MSTYLSTAVENIVQVVYGVHWIWNRPLISPLCSPKTGRPLTGPGSAQYGRGIVQLISNAITELLMIRILPNRSSSSLLSGWKASRSSQNVVNDGLELCIGLIFCNGIAISGRLFGPKVYLWLVSTKVDMSVVLASCCHCVLLSFRHRTNLGNATDGTQHEHLIRQFCGS